METARQRGTETESKFNESYKALKKIFKFMDNDLYIYHTESCHNEVVSHTKLQTGTTMNGDRRLQRRNKKRGMEQGRTVIRSHQVIWVQKISKVAKRLLYKSMVESVVE